MLWHIHIMPCSAKLQRSTVLWSILISVRPWGRSISFAITIRTPRHLRMLTCCPVVVFLKQTTPGPQPWKSILDHQTKLSLQQILNQKKKLTGLFELTAGDTGLSTTRTETLICFCPRNIASRYFDLPLQVPCIHVISSLDFLPQS
jgi:hypothetical protein